MTFRNVRRRKLHEFVVDQIEEAIFPGTMGNGKRLPSERDLMGTISVGRPAMRLALLLLAMTRLVQLCTGEHARVTRPTVEILTN